MTVFTKARSRWAVALAAVAMLAAGCGDDDDDAGDDGTTSTEATVEVPDGIEIGAGINDPEDPNIAVTEFLPEAVSVEVGETVTWEWEGAEPHSVTFLAPGQELPPPGSDESLFAPTPPTGPYDGASFVNSGLQPLSADAPPPFEMSFSAAGTYPYYCVIHPLMTGELTVVDAGGDADTPEDVAERRADERDQWLEEGRATKAALVDAEPESQEMDDGTTHWTIQMGATTEHVDVLAFAPTPAEAEVGDTIVFLNDSGAPHTATFFGEGAEPITSPVDPRVGEPAPGPSPQELTATGLYNTGLLPPNAPPDAGPPFEARSFQYVLQEAGTFSYVCLLHAPSQMVGVIEVT